MNAITSARLIPDQHILTTAEEPSEAIPISQNEYPISSLSPMWQIVDSTPSFGKEDHQFINENNAKIFTLLEFKKTMAKACVKPNEFVKKIFSQLGKSGKGKSA